MSAQFGAKFSAIGLAAARHCIFGFIILATAIVSAAGTSAFARNIGDPADPATRTAGVGYRSTIAPYTAQRPSTPAPWRARNDSVTPESKPGREPK